MTSSLQLATIADMPSRPPDLPEYMIPKYVDVRMLKIDPEYQRSLHEGDVEYMAQTWDYRIAQILLVSLRDNGDLIVIDGQTRMAAARRRRVPYLLAIVIPGLTQAEEADLFERLNGNRRAVHVIDRFRASRVAGNKRAIEINAAMARHGFKVDFSGPDTIASVQALEFVHEWGSLEPTLGIIRAAWPDRTVARSRNLVLALGAFDGQYGGRRDRPQLYDEGLLVEVLRELSPGVLLKDALKGNIEPTSYSVRSAWGLIAFEIAREYNHALPKGVKKLPKFEQPDLPRAALVISKPTGGVRRAA